MVLYICIAEMGRQHTRILLTQSTCLRRQLSAAAISFNHRRTNHVTNILSPLASNDLVDCVQGKARREPPRSAHARIPRAPPAIQQYKTLKLQAPNHGPSITRFRSVHPKPATPPSKTPIQTRWIVRTLRVKNANVRVGSSRAIAKSTVQYRNADKSPAPNPFCNARKIFATRYEAPMQTRDATGTEMRILIVRVFTLRR